MKLRGIEFGSVFGASGVMGFFGEGYPYHKIFRFIPGFSFDGVTFVGKTTTALPWAGNMPLGKDRLTPRDFKPDCISVRPFSGVALNAVGLSGPGIDFLLFTGRWQKRTDNFFLSFMSVGDTKEARLNELQGFCEKLKKALPDFHGHIGLQLNFSCPNTGHGQELLLDEVTDALIIARDLGIPLIPKFSALIALPYAKKIAEHPDCDALCVSNTIGWADIKESDRKKMFGSSVSPLARYGGGGISGNYLLPIVVDWIREARKEGITIPIIASGGVMSKVAVKKLKDAGADAISVGSVTFLRPWRLKEIAHAGHLLFG